MALLRPGDSGPQVRVLDEKLKELGLLKGKVNEKFDAATQAAVVKFKTLRGWDDPRAVAGARLSRALKLGDNFQGPEQPKKLRGATYNAKIHRPPQEVKRAVQQFTKANKLDFVQLQEISGYHKELSHIPGYRLITFPGSKDHGETGVLVRKGIDVKFPQSIEADHGWTNVHGGPAQPRAATSVKIAGWLRVASVHAPPGVDFHGDHATGGATRVDSYKSLTRKLANAAKRYQENDPDGAVLLGGDWNEGSHTSGVGSPSWLARVAHLTKVQKAPIDWEMVTGAKISNMKVRKNFGSDHHLVTFTIEKR